MDLTGKYLLRIIKRLLLILFLALMSFSANAQFADCATGLLSAPSADMNVGGTFIITNNFLNEHITPTGAATEFPWDYNTFGYGFDITFWSRLEIAYACVLFNGKWSSSATTYRQKLIVNQDRHFAAKLLALREGEIWKWTPSIAIGVSDPVTGAGGDYIGSGEKISSGNGFFNRYYIVATKHFNTTWGEFGGHLGYQYSRRADWNRTGVIAGVDWRPIWIQNCWFSPRFILEYDSNTPNFGFIADIWDNRFEVMFCLQNFQWVSFGLRFKLALKK